MQLCFNLHTLFTLQGERASKMSPAVSQVFSRRTTVSNRLLTGTLLAALCLMGPVSAQVKVDAKLTSYTAGEGVSGRIKSIGSDTMNNLMARWGKGFMKFYPSVETEVKGEGSGTAPPALIAGTATFGPMSREMTSKEIAGFKAKYGYEPTALR